MGKHRAGRAGIVEETRGRLFGRKPAASTVQSSAAAGTLDFGSAISITQAMEILERIAERKAQHVGTTLGFVDRIQVLP